MQRLPSAAAALQRRCMATKSFSVSLAQLLGDRTRRFESVTPCTPVLAAVERMALHNVGSLVVLDSGTLAGIVTERDVLVNVRRMLETESLPVSDIMTRKPVTVEASATVGECLAIMTDEDNRFRHLPVTDRSELVGVLSIRDLCDSLTRDHKDEVAELSSQIAKLANILGTDLQRRSATKSWTTRLRNLVLN